MKMRLLFCIALILQYLAWFPAISRPLLPHHTSQQPGTAVSIENAEASYSSIQDLQGSEARSYRGLNPVGSRPPNCQHKCDGCNPCIPIKVPTITSQVGIQYANYEPESWKCKCGPSIYSP